MCQTPQWKKYLIPLFTDVENVAFSLETTLKYKCGPLKAPSTSCDRAGLATADFAKVSLGFFKLETRETLSSSQAVKLFPTSWKKQD